jgi:hypothetical protein
MPWKFDPFIADIVWLPSGEPLVEIADISFGDQEGGDLEIDMGDRSNEISDIDQGFRVFDDGNI